MTREGDTLDKNAEQFWDDIYKASSPLSSGRPGQIVTRFTDDLSPGRALELGCARGDDAVWLARQGWSVVATDISATALNYARQNAERSGVADRITFERHDLSQSFPAGMFDLAFASFFQSPVTFPRAEVLRRAAEALASGGHLLIIDHGSHAPWSWSSPDTVHPPAEDTLAGLGLDPSQWQHCHVGAIERVAYGPDGQTATVLDNIIFLRRL